MTLVPFLIAARVTHSNTSHKHSLDQQRMSDNMTIVCPNLYSIYAETDSKYFTSLLNATAGKWNILRRGVFTVYNAVSLG
jgi:hypothetical protein